MKLTFLGTGTAVPDAMHRPSAVLMESGDLIALFDMGSGCVHTAAGMGFDLLCIENIFISHFHSDHVLDLIELLHANNATPQRVRTRPLNLYGPHGMEQFMDKVFQLFPETVPESYAIIIQTMATAPIKIGDAEVAASLSGHTENSVSYRIKTENKIFVYTADCTMSESLIAFASGTDVLITECSFPAGWKTDDHLNTETVALLAERTKAKNLILTHRYPHASEVDCVEHVKNNFSGNVWIAEDQKIFEF